MKTFKENFQGCNLCIFSKEMLCNDGKKCIGCTNTSSDQIGNMVYSTTCCILHETEDNE